MVYFAFVSGLVKEEVTTKTIEMDSLRTVRSSGEARASD